MYINFHKSWFFHHFFMKFLKIIKIELEISVLHQNEADSIQNFVGNAVWPNGLGVWSIFVSRVLAWVRVTGVT